MSFHQQMKTELGILDVFETNFVAIICWVVFGNYCNFVLSLCYFSLRYRLQVIELRVHQGHIDLYIKWPDQLCLASPGHSTTAVPRVAGRQVYQANAPVDSAEVYYQINVLILFLDHTLVEVQDWFGGARQRIVKLFALVPDVLTTSNPTAVEELGQIYLVGTVCTLARKLISIHSWICCMTYYDYYKTFPKFRLIVVIHCFATSCYCGCDVPKERILFNHHSQITSPG